MCIYICVCVLDEALFNLHSPFRSSISGLGILIRRMVVLSNSLKVTFPEVGMPWSTEMGGFGWGTATWIFDDFCLPSNFHQHGNP